MRDDCSQLKDRIPDAVDKCPNEPETYNGFEDDDGCPDKGKVVVHRSRIEILDKIYFETDRARIKPISQPILDAMAATLTGNPQIRSVEIQGHAAEGEREVWSLSGERAGAVRAALLKAGARTALKATAYGDTRPVDRGSSEAARSKNRRVELQILEREGEKPSGASRWTAKALEHPPTRAGAALREVAGGVRYLLPTTVTIPARSSVQLSILSRQLGGEEIYLFRPDANVPGSESHPLRAIRIENQSGLTLVPGPVAIFADGTFAGEGQLAELLPRESALIPYALDSGTTIRKQTSEAERPSRLVSLVKGVAQVEDQQLHVTRYEIAAGARIPGRLFLRHLRTPGTSATSLPPRTEIGPEAYLIPIPISPARTSTLRVEEREPRRREIQILEAEDSGRLALYLRPGTLAAADEKRLREVIALRQKRSELDTQVRGLREQLGDLGQRSGELRQTLRAVERSRNADALRRSLLARIKEASTETETVARELAKQVSAQAAARDRLVEALRGLQLEPPR